MSVTYPVTYPYAAILAVSPVLRGPTGGAAYHFLFGGPVPDDAEPVAAERAGLLWAFEMLTERRALTPVAALGALHRVAGSLLDDLRESAGKDWCKPVILGLTDRQYVVYAPAGGFFDTYTGRDHANLPQPPMECTSYDLSVLCRTKVEAIKRWVAELEREQYA